MLGTKTKIATVKIMVFKVGDLSLGMRLDAVQKVMTMPKIHKGSNSFLGITQVDDRELVVLDLHQTIYGSDIAREKGYFMVVKSAEQLYGLPSAQLPSMVEVPLADLHAVPTQYRDRDTLGIASQMVQVAIDKNTISTLFLLDPSHLSDLVQQYDSETMQQEYKVLQTLQSPVDVVASPTPSYAFEELTVSEPSVEGLDLGASTAELEELTVPEPLVEEPDGATSTLELEQFSVPQSIDDVFDGLAQSFDFENLIDLQSPIDVLDQPILTTADPFETDFQIDFS